MNTFEGLYMIADGGSSGICLSSPYDCDVYLIEGKGGYVIIDCGAGLAPERIQQNLAESGHEGWDCATILLTHGHADHSGGAFWFWKHTGAPIYALDETVGFVGRGEVEGISLLKAIRTEDYRFKTCPVQVAPGEQTVEIAGLSFLPIPTAGHTVGHCAWQVKLGEKTCLFSGDCIFVGGAISILPTWNCSPLAYKKSIERLLQVDNDGLFPSRHGFMIKGARPRWRKPIAGFRDWSFLPAGIRTKVISMRQYGKDKR
jgi:glyoxylase-like metal-dependent hydrolase (beta-lactamase superfamily II)